MSKSRRGSIAKTERPNEKDEYHLGIYESGKRKLVRKNVAENWAPLELEINKGLQVGSNKLIQEKDNSKDYNRHNPQREEGEVYSIPSLPAFR